MLNLGSAIEDQELWAEKSFVEWTRGQSRQVVVVHSDAPSLDLKVSVNGRLKPLTFLHHR